MCVRDSTQDIFVFFEKIFILFKKGKHIELQIIETFNVQVILHFILENTDINVLLLILFRYSVKNGAIFEKDILYAYIYI